MPRKGENIYKRKDGGRKGRLSVKGSTYARYTHLINTYPTAGKTQTALLRRNFAAPAGRFFIDLK